MVGFLRLGEGEGAALGAGEDRLEVGGPQLALRRAQNAGRGSENVGREAEIRRREHLAHHGQRQRTARGAAELLRLRQTEEARFARLLPGPVHHLRRHWVVGTQVERVLHRPQLVVEKGLRAIAQLDQLGG